MRSRLVNLSKHTHVGFTLIEVLISMAIAAMLIVSLMQIINPALDAREHSQAEISALNDARFAMQQMRNVIGKSNTLFIPKPDNPGTVWNESVRDVLAISMPHSLDRDKDGWADGNNDKDFLDLNQNGTRDVGEPERIDEDFYDDWFNNGVSGIYGIDDNGDGTADNGQGKNDDDEDGVNNEDNINGIDDDGDGAIDEDTKKDVNDDGESGVKGVDDDLDGNIDEDNKNDNDEDGSVGEDWYDPIVFYITGTSLMQRIPNLDPIDGTDFSDYIIAENVTAFSVERQIGTDAKTILLNITLTVNMDNGKPKTVSALIRLGGDL